MAGKAVAKKKDNAVVAADAYAEYAGGGFQNQTNEDVTLPFIDLLQGQSPELDAIDAAKPGMIINKVTNALYPGKEGIRFIPALTEHVYMEWVPREKGGGIVNRYPLEHPLVAKAREHNRLGAYEMENGNELIETFYVYGIVIGADDQTIPAVIAFTSTKIKPYQSWMVQARSLMGRTSDGRKFQYPLFSHVYRLTSVKIERNNYTWYNWQIALDGETADECRLDPEGQLFQDAFAIMEAVNKGIAAPDFSKQTQDPGGQATSGKEDGGQPPF